MTFCRSICKMGGRLDTADSDLPGLLWGTGRDDRMHQIDGHGQLSRTANPWIRQLIADARDAVAIAALDNMRTDPRTWMEMHDMQAASLRKCCLLKPPERPNAGDAHLSRWPAYHARDAATYVRIDEACTSTRLRPTYVAHNKHYVWRCYASPTAAFGAISASLNAAIFATTCAAATPPAIAHNPLRPVGLHYCSLPYYAAHAVAG